MELVRSDVILETFCPYNFASLVQRKLSSIYLLNRGNLRFEDFYIKIRKGVTTNDSTLIWGAQGRPGGGRIEAESKSISIAFAENVVDQCKVRFLESPWLCS